MGRKLFCPSMMCADFSCLKEEMEALERADIDIYHTDIMDGSFVPNISLGINEMGYPVMDYYKAYRELVTKIHTAYPDALIFIQGNMHVGIGSSQTNATFNNTNLVQRNTAIASLANGRNIFYIDPNTAVCDSDGNLIAEYTTDEIHLKAAYYNKWVQYLRENTIDPTVKPMTVEETKAAKEAKKNAKKD